MTDIANQPKASWRYRVIRRTYPLSGEIELEICEVYYRAGKPYGYVSRAPGGTTLDEIRAALGHMLYALTENILDVEDIGDTRDIVDITIGNDGADTDAHDSRSGG